MAKRKKEIRDKKKKKLAAEKEKKKQNREKNKVINQVDAPAQKNGDVGGIDDEDENENISLHDSE